MRSVCPISPAAVPTAWADNTVRRLDALRNGFALPVDADEHYSRLRASLAR